MLLLLDNQRFWKSGRLGVARHRQLECIRAWLFHFRLKIHRLKSFQNPTSIRLLLLQTWKTLQGSFHLVKSIWWWWWYWSSAAAKFKHLENEQETPTVTLLSETRIIIEYAYKFHKLKAFAANKYEITTQAKQKSCKNSTSFPHLP